MLFIVCLDEVLLPTGAPIQERVRAGLRNAKSKGVWLGRPRVFVSESRIDALRASGASWRAIAKKLGVALGMLHTIAQARLQNTCGGGTGRGEKTHPSELAKPLSCPHARTIHSCNVLAARTPGSCQRPSSAQGGRCISSDGGAIVPAIMGYFRTVV